MANETKNIFVSHYHLDAEKIENLKSLLSRNGMEVRDSSIYEAKSKNNAHNEDYIKSLIKPQINWAGTVIALIGKETSSSDWVNWEIKHAAEMGKKIVGVYLQGESDSDLPEEFVKHGDSLRKWNSSSIIDAINGDDTWDGPERRAWNLPRTTC
jgi:hypothetical protein